MKKTIFKSALIAIASVGLFAGGAYATSYPFTSEFDLISPDTYGDINANTLQVAGGGLLFDATSATDSGFYIWSNQNRTEWTILWTGTGTDPQNPDMVFGGDLVFYNNNIVASQEVKFESHSGTDFDDLDITLQNPGNDYLDFEAWAGDGGSTWYDGFSFTIEQLDSPSYITFDLTINQDNALAKNKIWFGENLQTIDPGVEATFAVAAPVPEPGTMMLFGAGLAGLAGFSRRRKN